MIKRKARGFSLNWLKQHPLTLRRYLRAFYTRYDWDVIGNFFWENPKEARTILEDFKKTNEAKQRTIINEISIGKSKIIIIVGGRGSGKTALSMFISNRLYKEEKVKRLYFVGEDIEKNIFPDWIKVVPVIEKVPDGHVAIVDEASLRYSARRAMDDENVLLTGLIATARHHDLTILFITQHLGLIDLNIFRLRDLIFYLRSSDYEIGERGGKATTRYKGWQKIRSMMMPRETGECLFENPSTRRFINFKFELPEFWNDKISKLYRGYDAREMLSKKRKDKEENYLNFYRRKQEIRAKALAKKGIKEVDKEEFSESNVS